MGCASHAGTASCCVHGAWCWSCMLHAGVCLQEPPAVQDGLCAGCCAHGAGAQILQVAELHASAESCL
jgi:hypothetical protein